MIDTLLKAIEETQAQKKSGLLMALVQLKGQVDEANAARPPDADLSFFFKDGELNSIVNRGTQGIALTALIPMISNVVRTQWVAMSPAMVPAGDAPLSVDDILKLMGKKKVPAAAVSAADAAALNRSRDQAVALENRAEQVFMQFMGRNGAAVLKKIRNDNDPHVNADGYVKACVAQLEPLIGKDSALKMIKG